MATTKTCRPRGRGNTGEMNGSGHHARACRRRRRRPSRSRAADGRSGRAHGSRTLNLNVSSGRFDPLLPTRACAREGDGGPVDELEDQPVRQGVERHPLGSHVLLEPGHILPIEEGHQPPPRHGTRREGEPPRVRISAHGFGGFTGYPAAMTSSRAWGIGMSPRQSPSSSVSSLGIRLKVPFS